MGKKKSKGDPDDRREGLMAKHGIWRFHAVWNASQAVKFRKMAETTDNPVAKARYLEFSDGCAELARINREHYVNFSRPKRRPLHEPKGMWFFRVKDGNKFGFMAISYRTSDPNRACNWLMRDYGVKVLEARFRQLDWYQYRALLLCCNVKGDDGEGIKDAICELFFNHELIESLEGQLEHTYQEVANVLMLMDGLAEQWGDEGVFRRCRDRLRQLVTEGQREVCEACNGTKQIEACRANRRKARK